MGCWPCENKLSDFCPVAPLNVEGKLFFSLVSKCLETHLIHNNKFINNSIQKGCMEKIPGCWEHLSMVWHAPKEARAQNSNSAVIWLDNGKMRLLIHFVEGHPSSLSLMTLVKFFMVTIDHHVPPFIANAYGFIPHKLIVFCYT